MFNVIGTETYQKEISRWDKTDKDAADNLPKQLSASPFVGDPLGYRFFREKRIRGKRVYFLIYEDLRLVLLVATSDKKEQQATIDFIKARLDAFRIEAERISKLIS